MNPRKLKFFHGFFGWPAFHFYVVGGALEVSSRFGSVRIERNLDLYFREPGLMARMYRVGRVVTLLFAIGCIILAWRVASRLFGYGGGATAALLLSVTPLFTMNARYMTADVPMLFWVLLATLASTHILAGGGRRWYVLAGIFLGLAAATRYQGGLAALAIAAAHLLRSPQPDAEDVEQGHWLSRMAHRLKCRDLWLAALLSVVVFLLLNPYILSRPGQFFREFTGELHGSRNPMNMLAATALHLQAGLGVMLAGTLLLALWMAAARRERKALFVLLGFGVPALLLWLGRPVMVRYYMPVLPLPILLVAWAFSRIHARGIEIGKTRTLLAAPALLLILLIATRHQSSAYGTLFSHRGDDTRALAGEWIASNIPKGATIGVVSPPWQFELPPLDEGRYKIVVVEQDPDALARAAPDYFVSSDLQFPPIAVRGPLREEESDFWTQVFEGRKGCRVVKRAEAWPGGSHPFQRHGPHDMRYANPVIVVSRCSFTSRDRLRTE
jgi:hypothetical protein